MHSEIPHEDARTLLNIELSKTKLVSVRISYRMQHVQCYGCKKLTKLCMRVTAHLDMAILGREA